MALIPIAGTSTPTIKLTLLELTVLLYNLIEAKAEFEHPSDSFETFYKRFDAVFATDKNIVEDVLYTASLLNDSGKFKHPWNRPLNQMVLDIATRNRVSLNKNTNSFERNAT